MKAKPDDPSRVPLLPPEPMDEREERAALSRSEELLFEQLRQEKRRGSPSGKSIEALRLPWLWSFGMGFAAMAALLVSGQWLWEQLNPAAPLLHHQGLQPSAKSKQSAHYRTAKSRHGHVVHPRHWRMRAHPSSRFHLVHKSATHAVVKLHKGGLHVALNPKKKQRFVVHHRGVVLRVLGTVFSADTHPKAMRIEVWRGEVQVELRGKRRRLRKGRGLRVEFGDGQERMSPVYPLPPVTQAQPLARVRWLLGRTPQEALAYALDLLHGQQLLPKVRSHVLFGIVDQMKGKGLWGDAERLLRAIFAKKLSRGDSQKALFEAAVACVRSRGRKPRCRKTFARFLVLYPKSRDAPTAQKYLKTFELPKD